MFGLRTAARAAAMLIFVGSSRLAAQESGMDGMMMSMDDSTIATGHLVLTPHWEEQPGDRERAERLVTEARAALQKYQDLTLAERDGYHRFAPMVKRQRVYHYSNRTNAFKARRTFDPAAPTALLYQPSSDGSLKLIGAMYTAPADLSLEELNQRIPLSIAQWHEHSNLCLPPGMSRRDTSPPVPLSMKWRGGPLTTEEACTAAGGEFRRGMRAWMVHVNMFEEGERVWEHKH